MWRSVGTGALSILLLSGSVAAEATAITVVSIARAVSAEARAGSSDTDAFSSVASGLFDESVDASARRYQDMGQFSIPVAAADAEASQESNVTAPDSALDVSGSGETSASGWGAGYEARARSGLQLEFATSAPTAYDLDLAFLETGSFPSAMVVALSGTQGTLIEHWAVSGVRYSASGLLTPGTYIFGWDAASFTRSSSSSASYAVTFGVTPASVPEPGSLLLAGLSLLALARHSLRARRR